MLYLRLVDPLNFLQERQSNHSSDKDQINEGIFNTLADKHSFYSG